MRKVVGDDLGDYLLPESVQCIEVCQLLELDSEIASLGVSFVLECWLDSTLEHTHLVDSLILSSNLITTHQMKLSFIPRHDVSILVVEELFQISNRGIIPDLPESDRVIETPDFLHVLLVLCQCGLFFRYLKWLVLLPEYPFVRKKKILI